jgi:flagellar basal-body rod protein FlgC
MIRALDISGSALTAQRVRLDVLAGNIANAFTTAQEDGTIEPYRRRVVTFAAGRPDGGPGVRVDEVLLDAAEFRYQYDPGHPHALREGPWEGYVRYPNVSVTMEYVDAMAASRAYEANVAMMTITRDMTRQAIQLFA